MNLVDFVYSDFPEAQEKRKVYSPWITTKKQKPPGPYIFDYNNEGKRYLDGGEEGKGRWAAPKLA